MLKPKSSTVFDEDRVISHWCCVSFNCSLIATRFLAFTLSQVPDISSVFHAMSTTLRSPTIITFGCLRIHLVCSSAMDSSRCSRCSTGAPDVGSKAQV